MSKYKAVKNIQKPSEEVIKLIQLSGDINKSVADTAQIELAKALELPLRQGVLVGANAEGIFEQIQVPAGTSLDYPLDMIAPGEEGDFVAFTINGNGRIPEAQVEGDYITIPTYMVGNSIDWLLRFAREGRYDIVARATQALEAGFVKKMNDDAWHTILSAGVDRNVLVYDADAAAGLFTKRLVSLMKVIMRRNGGGNTGSIKRGMLTDLYVSPEALEDIRNWGIDQVDEQTRRELYMSADGSVTRIFGVNLHDLDELGESQEYQLFYTNTLGASLGSDAELVVGLDLSSNSSFIMPTKMPVTIFNDPALHRYQKGGLYGWAEVGFGVLDNRRVILGSF